MDARSILAITAIQIQNASIEEDADRRIRLVAIACRTLWQLSLGDPPNADDLDPMVTKMSDAEFASKCPHDVTVRFEEDPTTKPQSVVLCGWCGHAVESTPWDAAPEGAPA